MGDIRMGVSHFFISKKIVYFAVKLKSVNVKRRLWIFGIGVAL